MLNLGSRADWSSEIDAFGRAFGGAFLFGIPLLYTMEMWWIGTYADLWKLVAFLGIAFVGSLGLVYFAGFRRSHSTRLPELLDQAVDVVAVGVVGSAVVLLVLNRIEPGDPLDSVIGKIVIQAVPLSIGAALAGAVFPTGSDGQNADNQPPDSHGWAAAFSDIGATVIGGVFLSFTIAPTEEVVLLAAELSIRHELALIALSLVVGYVIVFVSGFDTRPASARHPSPLQHPITETLVAYLVSLLVAFVALYFFDRIGLGEPLYATLTQVVVLGLPTTVGGAAGRLAI